MKQLSDSQLVAFDLPEQVNGARWLPVKAMLNERFPDGCFSFADAGGGIGVFADRILDEFPQSTGFVIDNSDLLLSKNVQRDRKTIVNGSIESLSELLRGRDVHVVFFNWVLHHLISDPASYLGTTRQVHNALVAARKLLLPGGCISVYEEEYEGFLIHNLPGHLIFWLTSSAMLAPIVRRGGANTAGVGVLFRSSRAWIRLFASAGLHVYSHTPDVPWEISLARKVGLLISSTRSGHFVLA